MKTTTLFVAALAAALLGGCGGHASNTLIPQPKASNHPTDGTKAVVTVVIPAHKTTSMRHTQYISPFTKSISFWVRDNSGNWQNQWSGTADVTPGSPGCTSDTQGNTTCTLTFGAIGGSIQYTVEAYDQTGGQGNVLGAATASATFATGADNKFSITLDGIPSKFVLALAKSSLPGGTPGDDPLTISAYDADGNLIVNSPDIVDTNGNATDGFQLNTTGVDGTTLSLYNNGNAMSPLPNTNNLGYGVAYPFTGLSLHYNGGLKTSTTLSLNVYPGMTANTPSFTVDPPADSASVMELASTSGWIWGYPGGVDGDVSNMLTVDNASAAGGCQYGDGVYGLSTDANNDLAYISDGTCGYQDIVGHVPGGNTAWEIDGVGHPGGTGLLPETFLSLGFDSSNNIYGFEDDGPVCNGCTTDIGIVDVLKAGSSGTFDQTMDLRAITCVNAPEAIAVAPDGTVYAAHVGDNNTPYEAIEVFAPGASGYFECTGSEGSGGSQVTAERYVGGTNSGLDKVTQLALDSSGNVYAANDYGNSVTVYGPTANGDVKPDRTISGPDTGISSPTGVAVDQFGNLYVLNSHQADAKMPTVTVYAPGATGDAAPTRTITPGSSSFNGSIALIK